MLCTSRHFRRRKQIFQKNKNDYSTSAQNTEHDASTAQAASPGRVRRSEEGGVRTGNSAPLIGPIRELAQKWLRNTCVKNTFGLITANLDILVLMCCILLCWPVRQYQQPFAILADGSFAWYFFTESIVLVDRNNFVRLLALWLPLFMSSSKRVSFEIIS